MNKFPYFSIKPYVVTHHQLCLTETVLIKGHNICFHLKKNKKKYFWIIFKSQFYLELCLGVLIFRTLMARSVIKVTLKSFADEVRMWHHRLSQLVHERRDIRWTWKSCKFFSFVFIHVHCFIMCGCYLVANNIA